MPVDQPKQHLAERRQVCDERLIHRSIDSPSPDRSVKAGFHSRVLDRAGNYSFYRTVVLILKNERDFGKSALQVFS
jgi:hypothetical protein